MSKWMKLRSLVVQQEKFWHADPPCSASYGAVLADMDRLDREEGEMPSYLCDLIRTLHLVANDHATKAGHGGAGREWQERACSAVEQAIELLDREATESDDGICLQADAVVVASCKCPKRAGGER